MFMSLSTVLNNNKNLKNGGAYWNRGAYLQKHVLWGALIRKGALIGRRALNRIITVVNPQNGEEIKKVKNQSWLCFSRVIGP